MTVEEQIKEIEAEMAKMQYNKATQFHYGKLKAKLSKLKDAAEKQASGGPRGLGYGLKKRGDATVVFVGYPSVGKSTLLNLLTNAESKVAAYDFTTLTVIPGMLEYAGAHIQLWDVPGLVEEAASGKGRGKEVLSVVRAADLIAMIVAPRTDVNVRGQYEKMFKELLNGGMRPNQKRPDVAVEQKAGGGIVVSAAVKLTHLDRKMIIAILHEFGIMNAEVTFREDATLDRFIDALSANRVYVPLLVILNKSDILKTEDRRLMTDISHVELSAEHGLNVEEFRKLVWERLSMIRIYLKDEGHEPDMTEPLILRSGSSVRSVCEALHKDFVRKFEHARLWGPSAKFPGQKVGLDFPVQDSDIVEIHTW